MNNSISSIVIAAVMVGVSLFALGALAMLLAMHLYEMPAMAVAQEHYRTTVVDVNGDGEVDLVLRDPQSSATTVLFGQGDGMFGLRAPASGGVVGAKLAVSSLTPRCLSAGRVMSRVLFHVR